MKSLDQVLTEYDKRRGEGVERQRMYSRYRSAFYGLFSPESGSVMDSAGRPVLRDVTDIRRELRTRSGTPNFVAPIVKDFVNLRGQLPLFTTSPGSEKEEARELATKQTRVVRSAWENSNMAVQQQRAAWYMSCYGDVVYVLDPLLPEDADDLSPAGVYITVFDPGICFPRFRFGRFAEELEDLYISYMIDADRAQREYGVDVQGDDDRQVECVLYYSRTEKRTIVGEQQARFGNIEHKFGWVPGQWIRTEVNDGGFGSADIAQAIDLSEELQSLFVMMSDSVLEAVYSPIILKNPTNIQEEIIVGPRAVISVEDNGEVSRLAPAPPPTAAVQVMGTMQENMYHVTGTAPIRQQQSIDKSNISGRAVHAVQGPLESKIALNQANIGYHFSKLNQKILLMYKRVPQLAEATMSLVGAEKGKSFTFEFSGDEVGGLTRQLVKWDVMVGQTRHERLVMALQAQQAGAAPLSYVAEQLEVDDPELFVEQGMNEMMMLSKIKQGAEQGGQQGQQDPGAAQAQIAGPASQGMNLAAGGDGGGGGGGDGPPEGVGGPAQPPPPGAGGPSMPGFPQLPSSPQAGGMGPPPQLPNMDEIIQQAMSKVPPRMLALVIGQPVIMDGYILVKTADWHANSVIRKAFKEFGIPVKFDTGSQAA